MAQQFEKGDDPRRNTEGRPKGSKNLIPGEARETVKTFVDQNWETFQKDWNRLRPERRIKYFVALLRFVCPLAKEIDFSVSLQQLSDQQLDELVQKILKNGT